MAACVAFLKRYGNRVVRLDQSWDLKATATPRQVREGRAVFTLAGAGDVRLVSGLDLPRDAKWTTLKHRPWLRPVTDPKSGKKILMTRYEQFGRVVQAEEVLKGGRWDATTASSAATGFPRVPAAEIEFPPGGRWDWDEAKRWVRVGDGLDARLDAPILPDAVEGFAPRFSNRTPLRFAIRVRNALSHDQAVPDVARTVRLELYYSPEVISAKGALVPLAQRAADWSRTAAKTGWRLKFREQKVLRPTEELSAISIDLKDWFDIKPGFYRVRLRPTERGDAEPDEGAELRFSVGTR